jgi:SAM-dependent methyltransferase
VRFVVGLDSSISMLQHAAESNGVVYVAGRAEAIPGMDAAFDVVSIGCAFHWCDPERLLAEVGRVVRQPGWFLIFDSDIQGWSDGSREPVERLTAEYWSHLPPCARRPYFDPLHHLREPFELHATTVVTEIVRLSSDQLSAFVRTQGSTVMAIASGQASPADLCNQLDRCISRLFKSAATKEVLFGGPLHILRRGSGS